ncbi:MAG: hypothetical protein ACYTGW_10370 [Planctomycetota bacterium]|jgi:hypothetical protein
MRSSPFAAALVLTASLLTCHLASQNPRDVQVIGAPIIGKTIKIRLTAPQQSVTDKDRYYLMVSPHTNAVTQFPPATLIFGDFKLDPKFFLFVLISGINQTQIDLPAPLPNDTSLVGVSADLQYADQSMKKNRIDLSDEAVVTVLAAASSGGGVGTALIAQGSRTFSRGFAVGRVDNTNVGNPTILNTAFKYDREVQYLSGDRGFVQGLRGQFSSGDHHADIEIFSGGRYMLDGRSGSHGFSPIVLPDGRRLAIVRDAKKATEFLGVVFDPVAGTVTEIAGSRAAALGINNVYAPYLGLPVYNPVKFKNIVMVFQDNDGISSGHQDQVFLWRLDNSKWPVTANKLPGEGTPVLDVSYRDTNGRIPFGWNIHDGGIYIVNEGVVFRINGVTGPIGVTNWDLWFVPFDGSAAAKHFTPAKNGTNNALWWLYLYTHRTSRDGKNLAFPTGSNQSDARTENDIHGFYGITAANMAKPTMQPINITGFKTSTPVQPFFGIDRERTFYLDYSPNGELLAFISGTQKITPPNVLYIARSDGSTAGKLVPVKTGTGGLPAPPTAGWVHMSHVHWRNNNELVVFAGAGSSVTIAQSMLDLYHVKLDATNPHDGSKATVTKLTSAGNIDVRWSLALRNLQGSETLFFGRDYDASATTTALELVGYDPTINRPFSLTGKEFSTGGTSMELNESTEMLQFRQRPGSKEIYYVGRPWDASTSGKVPDMNVYKFSSLLLTQRAQAVTKYTGTGGTAATAVNIHSLVVLSDGSVAYVAVKGPASATNKEVVTFWKAGAPSPVALGRFARGSRVMPGSLYAQEKIGGVAGAHGIYWVQGDLGTATGFTTVVVANTRAYFARTDDLLKGHPIQLTGQPSPNNDSGFTQILGVSATNK